MNVPMIHTKEGGITVILQRRPFSVATTDKHFEEVYEAVERGEEDWFILEIFERSANKIKTAVGSGIEYSGGAVLYNGEQLRGYAVDKLLALFDKGRDATPLVKFLEKIQANPSKTVLDNLYQFLEHGQMPLTTSGNFVAYKAVRDNYFDIHSGTMDNSIGKTVSIARNKVDEDRNRTCSSGLHVCSFDYLPNFAHDDGHVVLVEVNPKDVVAIPSDYNNTKMRVSEYTVIGEVEDYYKLRENVLAGDQIWDEEYTVWNRTDEEDDIEADETFDSFEEARAEAFRDVTERGMEYAEVQNSEGKILFKVGE